MRRKAVEIMKDRLFVDSEPIDEPECNRDIDDPASAFARFLLPRIEKDTGAASREIRTSMEAGRSLSDAILDAIETLPAAETRRLRAWVEQASESRIYAYIRILGDRDARDGVDHGLRLTTGGPRDKVIAEELIDNYGSFMDEHGVLLEGQELREEVEEILFDSYMTARDKALMKSACVKLRTRG